MNDHYAIADGPDDADRSKASASEKNGATRGDKHELSNREQVLRDLVKQLRTEANELKSCFTRYAFQAAGVSSAIIGLVARYIFEHPLAGLGSIAAILIATATCRMGTYKYAASNRHFGYELHLSRTRNVPVEQRGRWLPEYRGIEWEEAMRAWRIVQPTLFEAIQKRSRLFIPDRYRRGFKPRKGHPQWFNQESLLGQTGANEKQKRPIKYYAGSYLRTMLSILQAVAALGLILMGVMTFLVWKPILQPTSGQTAEVSVVAVFCAIASVAALVFVVIRWLVDHSRRRVLEDGLLSIHACAIIWQATVIAHYEALELARQRRVSSQDLVRSKGNFATTPRRDGDGAGFLGYTYWLGQKADSIAASAADIHRWVGERPADEPLPPG